jgi:hypothetical protein
MNYAASDKDLSSILANTPAYPGRYKNSAVLLHCHVTSRLSSIHMYIYIYTYIYKLCVCVLVYVYI